MIIPNLTKDILEKMPKARDDDSLLICKQWAAEMKVKGTDPVSLLQVYRALESKTITPPETITRARRKLQEEFPELRGEKYYSRQQKAMDFKEDIKTNNWRR